MSTPTRPPPARKKKPTTIYLEPEQQDRLRAYTERTGVPGAVVIREGIDLALSARERRIPGDAPATPGGPAGE